MLDEEDGPPAATRSSKWFGGFVSWGTGVDGVVLTVVVVDVLAVAAVGGGAGVARALVETTARLWRRSPRVLPSQAAGSCNGW